MNAQLYSARELELVRSVVAIMRSYSLTFTATYQDGVSSFIFCPFVYLFFIFSYEALYWRNSPFLIRKWCFDAIQNSLMSGKIRSDHLLYGKNIFCLKTADAYFVEFWSQNETTESTELNLKGSGIGGLRKWRLTHFLLLSMSITCPFKCILLSFLRVTVLAWDQSTCLCCSQ